jgi:SAM-dependent methyltransferase
MDDLEYAKMFAVEDRHFWFRGKRAWIAALLDRHLGPRLAGDILDVGCGTGANLLFLAHWGEVFGIEKHRLALQYCRQRGLGSRITPGLAQQLPFADGRFALVCALDVLYHRDIEPEIALREMHRVVRAGGHLLVTDSAVPFLTGPHDRAVWARERFTKRSLRALVEGAGFVIQQLSYANFFLFPFILALRLIERLRVQPHSSVGAKLPLANRALLQVFKFEATLLGRGISFPWGSSIVCLAKRT